MEHIRLFQNVSEIGFGFGFGSIEMRLMATHVLLMIMFDLMRNTHLVEQRRGPTNNQNLVERAFLLYHSHILDRSREFISHHIFTHRCFHDFSSLNFAVLVIAGELTIPVFLRMLRSSLSIVAFVSAPHVSIVVVQAFNLTQYCFSFHDTSFPNFILFNQNIFFATISKHIL